MEFNYLTIWQTYELGRGQYWVDHQCSHLGFEMIIKPCLSLGFEFELSNDNYFCLSFDITIIFL